MRSIATSRHHTCIHFILSHKAKSSAQRFKVMSQLRCLQYSGADKRTATVATPCAGGGERVHICDAMQESGKEERLVLLVLMAKSITCFLLATS